MWVVKKSIIWGEFMNGRIERKFEKRSMKDYNESYVNIHSKDLDLLNKKESKVADKCIKYLEMIRMSV